MSTKTDVSIATTMVILLKIGLSLHEFWKKIVPPPVSTPAAMLSTTVSSSLPSSILTSWPLISS